MDNFGFLILSWLVGQEFPQEEFDKDFIDYFKTNPNGYDEVMKEVKQVPEDLRQRFIDMFTRLNDKAMEE
jgi:hypothetical protein